MTVLEILTEAKATIEETGWVQYNLEEKDHNGYIIGYCLVGALNVVTTLKDWENFQKARDTLEGIINPWWKVWFKKGNIQHLASWNDTKGRTKEQVLDLLNKGIRVSQNA